MARPATKPTDAPASPGENPSPVAPQPRMDTASLGLADLANAILARQVRPRAADIRRLAEEVLRKKKRKKDKKDGKARKLSKIPARKAKK